MYCFGVSGTILVCMVSFIFKISKHITFPSISGHDCVSGFLVLRQNFKLAFLIQTNMSWTMSENILIPLFYFLIYLLDSRIGLS